MVKYNHIALTRTDNIGDVVLTLPMAVAIKKYCPNCKVSIIARDYVMDVVHSKQDVDSFISFDRLQAMTIDEATLFMKQQNIDVIIHVSPNKLVAKLAKLASIHIRVGNARKLYNLLYCNKLTYFSRAKSILHESQLNLKMLSAIDIRSDYAMPEVVEMIQLKRSTDITEKVQCLLDEKRFNLLLHPLSNGNGREWPLGYYKDLIDRLPCDQFNVIISGMEKEFPKLNAAGLLGNRTKNAVGKFSLAEFIILLSKVDALVISGTGPLHIASALGTTVFGLFPNNITAGPSRWGCVGSNAESIVGQNMVCITKCSNNDCSCMRKISVDMVYDKITSLLDAKL